MNKYENIVNQLIMARKMSGKTQTDIAGVLGVTRCQATNLELGNSEYSLRQFLEICEFLGVMLSDFYQESEVD